MEDDLAKYSSRNFGDYIRKIQERDIFIQEIVSPEGTIFVARKKDKDGFDVIIDTDPMPRVKAIKTIQYAIEHVFTITPKQVKQNTTQKIQVQQWGK